MKSVPKLIRRFVGIMLLSSVLLIILNLALLVIYTLNQAPNSSPWMTAQKVADNLLQDDNGAILKKWTAKSERWYNNKKRRETHGKH